MTPTFEVYYRSIHLPYLTVPLRNLDFLAIRKICHLNHQVAESLMLLAVLSTVVQNYEGPEIVPSLQANSLA